MPRRVRMEDEEGIPPRRLSANPPSQSPNPYEEENTGDPTPRRQRGANFKRFRGRAAGTEMGESGRQELTIRGKRYIRDGSWWVDADALAPYGGDPDAAPPEIVEANRMEYSRGLNRARRENVAAFNDENWQGEAQAAGYGDWREARRKAMQAFQADPVRFWQMSANGGNGDLTVQPTADDLERFSHWLWITNPANMAEVMRAQTNRPTTPATPPPTQTPATDPYDPNAKVLQVPRTPPAPVGPPVPTPANDTIGTPMIIGGGTGVHPAPAAPRPQTTRPPQPAVSPNLGSKPSPAPGPMTPLAQTVGGPTMPRKPQPAALQKSWGY